MAVFYGLSWADLNKPLLMADGAPKQTKMLFLDSWVTEK